MAPSDLSEKALEKVLTWSNPPPLAGVVGRYHDDTDGDRKQQLLMEATKDGQFRIWCLYRWHEEIRETRHFVVPLWLKGPATLLWSALRLAHVNFPQAEAPSHTPPPKLPKPILSLLGPFPWPPYIVALQPYTVLSEDGNRVPLTITFSQDGDAWISIDEMFMMSYRFRTDFGGGMSVPVRNALVVMAEAICRHDEGRLCPP